MLKSNGKNKILLIEDEEALVEVLAVKLKKENYQVEVAYDGESGYEKIKKWKPDLILLDIVLPKMDGYEVLEKLNEDKNKTPVIIISNSGQFVELEKTQKLGAVDFLVKTQFDPSEVVTKVRNYLENKSIAKNKEIKPKEDEAGGKKIGVKVLIVEDDSFLREICVKKLMKEGFTVFEAVDGEQSLKEIEQIKPDVVLLDIMLPAIDGFEVLSKIRSSKDQKIKKVPVIMLSNLGQEEDIRKAIDMGADSYLVKAHFTTDEIVNKIKKTLKEK